MVLERGYLEMVLESMDRLKDRLLFLGFFLLVGVLVCWGVLKVTCLASVVFVMVSITVWELASLGTLNSTIPWWTIAGYDSRVKGLVESSKM